MWPSLGNIRCPGSLSDVLADLQHTRATCIYKVGPDVEKAVVWEAPREKLPMWNLIPQTTNTVTSITGGIQSSYTAKTEYKILVMCHAVS
jgi:hypothetical protein